MRYRFLTIENGFGSAKSELQEHEDRGAGDEIGNVSSSRRRAVLESNESVCAPENSNFCNHPLWDILQEPPKRLRSGLAASVASTTSSRFVQGLVPSDIAPSYAKNVCWASHMHRRRFNGEK